MVKNSNISKDQWHFLKGHIEAIVAMFDHSNYFKFLVILVKFIWSMNYNAFLMILIAPGGRLTKLGNRNCQFQQGFLCFFDFCSKPLRDIDPSKCLPKRCGGG